MRGAILATFVVVVVGFGLPASADERPSDPFGNHTTEIEKGTAIVDVWDSLEHQLKLDKAYFNECIQSKDDTCPLIPALEQMLDEIREYQGEARLGHLNLSINLMIKAAPGGWVGPLEALTMRHGDCKSYSIAKYAAVQRLGISADHVRLVIVHIPASSEDHMVVAVYENGEWFILDNLTNELASDTEKTDYVPLAILDYQGARQFTP